jgi:hypothetical protein
MFVEGELCRNDKTRTTVNRIFNSIDFPFLCNAIRCVVATGDDPEGILYYITMFMLRFLPLYARRRDVYSRQDTPTHLRHHRLG